jgi:hypothetical protein
MNNNKIWLARGSPYWRMRCVDPPTPAGPTVNPILINTKLKLKPQE